MVCSPGPGSRTCFLFVLEVAYRGYRGRCIAARLQLAARRRVRRTSRAGRLYFSLVSLDHTRPRCSRRCYVCKTKRTKEMKKKARENRSRDLGNLGRCYLLLCTSINVHYLAMPRIAWGLDGQRWQEVEALVDRIFADTGIKVL